MLFECATVTSVSASHLTLQSSRGSACERCARGEGCGGGIIGKLVFRRQPILVLQVTQARQFKVGQEVELSVPAQRVMALAAAVYLIPLTGLMAGAVAGQWFTGTDVAALGAGAAGFAGALWMVRHRIRSVPGHWLHPTIRTKAEESGE
jgi:sigma-E factor negative regulatory protein RseC